MKNLKIGPKLILCFMLVTCLSSISGILGAFFLHWSDQNYSKALVENGFSQGDIGSFDTYLNKGSAVVRDIVLLTEEKEIQNSRSELEQIDQNAFESALDIILNAKHIYIVGIRSCAPLASFMSFYFNLMFDNVHLLHTSSSSELFEQMVRISEEDVIIGISFPRYSMRTLKAMEFANNRNAKVITLTDSVHSPMNLYSSCNLIAKSDMASIVDSLVAPLSVINALIVALCMRKQSEVAETLEALEDIWNEYQVYESDEINYIDDHMKMRYGKVDNVDREDSGIEK